jgi:hypothetical protein
MAVIPISWWVTFVFGDVAISEITSAILLVARPIELRL